VLARKYARLAVTQDGDRQNLAPPVATARSTAARGEYWQSHAGTRTACVGIMGIRVRRNDLATLAARYSRRSQGRHGSRRDAGQYASRNWTWRPGSSSLWVVFIVRTYRSYYETVPRQRSGQRLPFDSWPFLVHLTQAFTWTATHDPIGPRRFRTSIMPGASLGGFHPLDKTRTLQRSCHCRNGEMSSDTTSPTISAPVFLQWHPQTHAEVGTLSSGQSS
jgi:hypothetical protein